MPRKRVKPSAPKPEPCHGLKDMFINRPGGDAGKIMSMVWGNSEEEFGEIVAREVEEQQRKHPERFVNKIAPRIGRVEDQSCET